MLLWGHASVEESAGVTMVIEVLQVIVSMAGISALLPTHY
jgi:hypothetical protein